ncbi:MAG: hypothetical protein ABFR31_12155, partial [Thermodesulfobacteriota bacterium]
MKYLYSVLTISICLFFLFGCNTVRVGIQGPGSRCSNKTYHKHGPPPHAPAHGYRHKHGPPPHAPAHGYRHKHHDGYEIEYDSRAGAYIVLNVPETYFGNNLYIRLSTYGNWMVSSRLEGRWRVAVGNEVPYRLREYKGKKKWKSKKWK